VVKKTFSSRTERLTLHSDCGQVLAHSKIGKGKKYRFKGTLCLHGKGVKGTEKSKRRDDSGTFF